MGKSWLALAMADAAARGGRLLEWHAPWPARVAFVDAAMGQGLLQARLRAIAGDDAPPRRLVIAPGDAQGDGLPDLGTAAGLAALDALVVDADLVVLDGLSALVRAGRGVGARWQALADWLRALRRRGQAVLLVEAAEPRCLAALADTVLRLGPAFSYLPVEGLRVQLHVAAARALTGRARRRCEARLSTAGGRAAWTRLDALDEEALEAWRLHEGGLSYRAIGKRLDVPSTTAWRLVQRALAIDPAVREGGAAGDALGIGTVEQRNTNPLPARERVRAKRVVRGARGSAQETQATVRDGGILLRAAARCPSPGDARRVADLSREGRGEEALRPVPRQPLRAAAQQLDARHQQQRRGSAKSRRR